MPGHLPTSADETIPDVRRLRLSYSPGVEQPGEKLSSSSGFMPLQGTPSPVNKHASLMSPLSTVGTPSLSHRIASARDGKGTPNSASDADANLVGSLMIHTDLDDFQWETFEGFSTSPLQEVNLPTLPPPQAVELARNDKGFLSVISNEDDVALQVQPITTHLSIKQCPLMDYRCLTTPHMLVVLDLAGSRLRELPAELAQCTMLEELNISNNVFHESSSEAPFAPLAYLQRLRMLLTDDNSLTRVPVEVMSLTQLHILSLRRNRLTFLPTWLSRLDYLQVLLIEGNKHLTPPWRSVLAPLLHMERVGEREGIEPPALAKVGALGEIRRPSGSSGLFQRLRQGTMRAASNPERPSKWFRSKDSGSTSSESSRNGGRPNPPSALLRSLMIPLSTPSQTYLLPIPAVGDKNLELPFPSFFLPVYEGKSGDDSIRWFQTHGVVHVHQLLGYLRDLDDLQTEYHRDTVLVSVPMGSSLLGSPGMSLSAISSPIGDSDPTPLDTPGEVALRGGILEEAGANVVSTPSTDVSTPVGSMDVKENAVKRGLVLNEVIETERTYVAGLTELMEIYVQGARQPLEAGTDQRVMSVQMERRIFGHVEGIVHFHRDAFLPSLEQATQRLKMLPDPATDAYATTTAEIAADVANVFSAHAAYFKMYMNYVNQYETAVSSIARWSEPSTARGRSSSKASSSSLTSLGQRLLHPDALTDERNSDDTMHLSASEHRRFQSYLRRCRRDPRHSQISLEGYLLLPIQRIPRYRMMLDQLIKCTSCDMLPDMDRESLVRAFAHISLVASWVNEGKRQSEQGRRLLQWQTKLRGNFSAPLVQPHRRLVCDGPLRLCRVNKRLGRAPNVYSEDDILEQSVMDVPVHLLLCNDLAVVVSEPGISDTPATQVPPLSPSDPDVVDLIAVLKPQVRLLLQHDRHLRLPPASVVGDVYVRVVDARYVFYFLATTPRDAVRWRTAINAQPF